MEAPFIWQIADSGYQVKPVKGDTRLVFEPDTTWTRYEPLQKFTGLYRSFAELNNQDEILRFANKYGLLLIPVFLEFSDSLEFWEDEIQRLRSAVKLWDAIPEKGHAYLKEVIKWKKSPKRVLYMYSESNWKTIDRIDTTGFQIKFGDLVWPAYLHLQDVINNALNDRVAPKMLWDESNELKLFHVPKNLLGAMWLQFADAVTYNLEYRACGWCGKPFEVTRSTRSDRLYCSNSCRVSASRKRTRSVKRK